MTFHFVTTTKGLRLGLRLGLELGLGLRLGLMLGLGSAKVEVLINTIGFYLQ